MKGKSYTFFIASTPGKLRKLIVPAYILHGLAVLVVIGGITVTAAVGSYSRMLWKVGNYNALRHDQENLKKQYQALQSTVKNTNQRLDSLQSLATACCAITRWRSIWVTIPRTLRSDLTVPSSNTPS